MVVYQFRPPDDTWAEWKRTVPRDKSLEQRLIELIEADTEGRVVDRDDPLSTDELDELLADATGESVEEIREGAEQFDIGPPETTDPLATVEFPNTVDREAGEAAIEAAVAYIEEHGEATKKDLVQAVMPEHSLGYDTEKAIDQVETPGERFRGAWWRRVVKPGLDAHSDVAKPGPQAAEWRYTG